MSNILIFIYLFFQTKYMYFIPWSLYPGVQLTLGQHLFRWWFVAAHEKKHCLNRWWQRRWAYYDLGKMADILQMTFSNAFPWSKNVAFWFLKKSLKVVYKGNTSVLVRVMDLVLNRRHTIIWNNDGPGLWSHVASLGYTVDPGDIGFIPRPTIADALYIVFHCYLLFLIF